MDNARAPAAVLLDAEWEVVLAEGLGPGLGGGVEVAPLLAGHAVGLRLAPGLGLALAKGVPRLPRLGLGGVLALRWTMSSRSPGLPANRSFHMICAAPGSWPEMGSTAFLPKRPNRLPCPPGDASSRHVPCAEPESGISIEKWSSK